MSKEKGSAGEDEAPPQGRLVPSPQHLSLIHILGTNVNPFVLIFAFCILTSLLATLTGSTIGTVYVLSLIHILQLAALGVVEL